jgi:DNA-binding response OmpR family regulator
MVHEQRPPLVQVKVKRICIVEDETDMKALLVQIIAQETPFDVAAVTNGREALNVAKEVQPHLFILDYLLPGMNGIDLYDQLQTIEEVADTPVIMLSANLPTKEIEER